MTVSELLYVLPSYTKISYKMIHKQLETGQAFYKSSMEMTARELRQQTSILQFQITCIDVYNRSILIDIRKNDTEMDW